MTKNIQQSHPLTFIGFHILVYLSQLGLFAGISKTRAAGGLTKSIEGFIWLKRMFTELPPLPCRHLGIGSLNHN